MLTLPHLPEPLQGKTLTRREKFLQLILVEIAARDLLRALEDLYPADTFDVQDEMATLRSTLAPLSSIPASIAHS